MSCAVSCLMQKGRADNRHRRSQRDCQYPLSEGTGQESLGHRSDILPVLVGGFFVWRDLARVTAAAAASQPSKRSLT